MPLQTPAKTDHHTNKKINAILNVFFSGELFHRFVLLAILLCGLCLIFALYILIHTLQLFGLAFWIWTSKISFEFIFFSVILILLHKWCELGGAVVAPLL